MGFLTGNKTEEERIQEEINKILTEGQVLIDLAVGTHGYVCFKKMQLNFDRMSKYDFSIFWYERIVIYFNL